MFGMRFWNHTDLGKAEKRSGGRCGEGWAYEALSFPRCLEIQRSKLASRVGDEYRKR